MKRTHTPRRAPIHTLGTQQLSEVLGGEGNPMPAARRDGQPMPGAPGDGSPLPAARFDEGTPMPA